MRTIAAYMLAVLGGNNSPSVEDLRKIFVAGGVDFNEESANQIINELKGKNVYEVMKAGSAKLVTFGGVGGGSSAPTTTTTTNTAPTQVQEEEKPVEKEEESAEIGGLFGDDEDF